MPVSIESEAFLWLATAASGVPAPIWILALLLLVITRARQDRVRAQGYLTGGRRGSGVCGIRVKRLKIVIFMISGLMAAIRWPRADRGVSTRHNQRGDRMELDAIAAPVLGGTSLTVATAPCSAH